MYLTLPYKFESFYRNKLKVLATETRYFAREKIKRGSFYDLQVGNQAFHM